MQKHQCPDWSKVQEPDEDEILTAIRSNRIDIVKAYLERKGDPDLRTPSGKSALCIAVQVKNVDIMKLLLDHKAYVDLSEYIYGLTPLMYASMIGFKEGVELLLDNQADIGIKAFDNNECRINGFTALDFAKNEKHVEVEKILVNHSKKVGHYAAGSYDFIFAEAQRQGWLGKSLSVIPEVLDIYRKGSIYFYEFIRKADSQYHEALVYQAVRYLFAKGVEGVIIWGKTPDGKISIGFDTHYLVEQNYNYEINEEYHYLIDEALSIGESLFKVHQSFILEQQRLNKKFHLFRQMQDTLECIPMFAVHYGLYKQYDSLM